MCLKITGIYWIGNPRIHYPDHCAQGVHFRCHKVTNILKISINTLKNSFFDPNLMKKSEFFYVKTRLAFILHIKFSILMFMENGSMSNGKLRYCLKCVIIKGNLWSCSHSQIFLVFLYLSRQPEGWILNIFHVQDSFSS